MAIRVRVYAPGFINHESLDEDGFIELTEGCTVGGLCKRLKVPFTIRLVMACSVNYEQAKFSTPLKDGDVVSFLFPIAGG